MYNTSEQIMHNRPEEMPHYGFHQVGVDRRPVSKVSDLEAEAIRCKKILIIAQEAGRLRVNCLLHRHRPYRC
jgi:hypothetical protein